MCKRSEGATHLSPETETKQHKVREHRGAPVNGMSHYEIGTAGPAERFSLGPLKDE